MNEFPPEFRTFASAEEPKTPPAAETDNEAAILRRIVLDAANETRRCGLEHVTISLCKGMGLFDPEARRIVVDELLQRFPGRIWIRSATTTPMSVHFIRVENKTVSMSSVTCKDTDIGLSIAKDELSFDMLRYVWAVASYTAWRDDGDIAGECCFPPEFCSVNYVVETPAAVQAATLRRIVHEAVLAGRGLRLKKVTVSLYNRHTFDCEARRRVVNELLSRFPGSIYYRAETSTTCMDKWYKIINNFAPHEMLYCREADIGIFLDRAGADQVIPQSTWRESCFEA